jgi:hypothetical protein
MNERSKSVPELSDAECILDLAFLANIISLPNERNTKRQGKGKLFADVYSDIKAFGMKLKLIIKRVEERNLGPFPSM